MVIAKRLRPGTVLSASERPGAKLRKGTAVDLVVSIGPKPIAITNYEGTPYDAAAAALTSAGLRVGAKRLFQYSRQRLGATSGSALWPRRKR